MANPVFRVAGLGTSNCGGCLSGGAKSIAFAEPAIVLPSPAKVAAVMNPRRVSASLELPGSECDARDEGLDIGAPGKSVGNGTQRMCHRCISRGLANSGVHRISSGRYDVPGR